MFNILKHLHRLRRSKAFSFVFVVLVINCVMLSLMKYENQIIITSSGVSNLVQEKFASFTIQSKSEVPISYAIENYHKAKVLHTYTIPSEFSEKNSPIKTWQYDPRFAMGVYLSHIISQYKTNGQNISQIEISFSWYDWADLTVLNPFIELEPSEKPTCEYVCQQVLNDNAVEQMKEKFKQNEINKQKHQQELAAKTEKAAQELIKQEQAAEREAQGQEQEPLQSEEQSGLQKRSPLSNPHPASNARAVADAKVKNVKPGKAGKECHLYCKTDQSPTQPGFRVFKQLHKGRSDVKTLQLRSYLYSEAPAPLSLVLITSDGNLQINVKPNSEVDDKSKLNMINSGLLDEYLTTRGSDVDLESLHHELFDTITFTPPNRFPSYRLKLEHERFTFDAPKYLATTEAKTAHQKSFRDSLVNSLHTKDDALKKYLREVEISRDTQVKGHHFDGRFFNDGHYSEEQRQVILTKLVKSFLQLTFNAKLMAWIAHGGLLSHRFNGLNFPWDDDSDVQMPYEDFAKLSELYNQSIIIEDYETGYGRYFLDTTNSITHRTKGNGLNRIDGRFIDVNTGFFIDITALGVSPTFIPRRMALDFMEIDRENIKYSDPNYEAYPQVYDELTSEELRELSRGDATFAKSIKTTQSLRRAGMTSLTKTYNITKRYDVNYKMTVYNCRNNHFYQLKDISPLRFTYHDKIPMYIPNDLDRSLKEEYKDQSILAASFKEYFYLPQLRIWLNNRYVSLLPDKQKKADKNLLEKEDVIKLLDDEYILNQFIQTYEATILHEKELMLMNDDTMTPKQVDEALEELMMWPVRKFDMIWKDPFMQQLENQVLKDHHLAGKREKEYQIAVEQINREYAGTVDYTFGDDSIHLDMDFNTVGRSLKDLLDDYKRGESLVNIDSRLSELSQKLQDSNEEDQATRSELTAEISKLMKLKVTRDKLKKQAEDEAKAARLAEQKADEIDKEEEQKKEEEKKKQEATKTNDGEVEEDKREEGGKKEKVIVEEPSKVENKAVKIFEGQEDKPELQQQTGKPVMPKIEVV